MSILDYKQGLIDGIKKNFNFNQIYVLNNLSDDITKYTINTNKEPVLFLMFNDGMINETGNNNYGLNVFVNIYFIIISKNIRSSDKRILDDTNDVLMSRMKELSDFIYNSDDVLKLSKYRTKPTGYSFLNDERLTRENLSGLILSAQSIVKLI